ncbi:MAG: SDR family oxidoreductase [Sphingopyxis granuli]|uniref:SDR family oxidoreductase n=1 Tax=Sphingopyxis granuli TaxID=267128 RepID=UPI003C719444
MSGGSVEVLADACLAGRRCLVTGAGSGIGRAITLRLAALGAHVTGVGRHLETLEETAKQAGERGGCVAAVACDVRNADMAAEMISQVAGDHGIDLLVNNAGGQFYAPATQISRRGWDAVIDLNLSAVFSLILAAHPHLAKRRGAVVNMSLTGIDRGIMGAAHGVAARAGVLGLTRTLALEWGSQGIRLNCIGPGIVFTENLDPTARERALERMDAIPLGRGTDTQAIAELVAFLASDAAQLITGQLLQIDGGAHLGAGIHAWAPEKVRA